MTPSYEDPFLTVYTGEARAVLRTLPDKSVHMVCTSPPYWGLRDYGLPPSVWGQLPGLRYDHRYNPDAMAMGDCKACGRVWEDHHWHEWGDVGKDAHASGLHVGGSLGADREDGGRAAKAGAGSGQRCVAKIPTLTVDMPCPAWLGQLGLEPTPELYVEHLVEVIAEVHRVLRDDGTLWMNLGDAYATDGPGAAYGWTNGKTSARDEETMEAYIHRPSGLPAKNLIGVPWMAAFALRKAGWILRADIVWHKPNPMPESVQDRPTKAHEMVFLLAKQDRYFYDHHAIKEVGATGSWAAMPPIGGVKQAGGDNPTYSGNQPGSDGMSNKRDVWSIPTAPFPEAHYAVWPPKLVEPMVKAGTSEYGVCANCGTPYPRETERIEVEPGKFSSRLTGRWVPGCICSTYDDPAHGFRAGIQPFDVTRATVLDPFGGSGTTGLVAQALGRRAILIDLSDKYLDLQLRRASREFGVGGRKMTDDGTALPPDDSIWAKEE